MKPRHADPLLYRATVRIERRNFNPPMLRNWFIELRYLVPLGRVRIKIILARENTVSRISQLIALAASTANSTARRFKTGSAPGNPRQVGQICVFGSPPYLLTQPQNAFDSVKS